MVSRLEVLLLYRNFLRIGRQIPDIQLRHKFAFNVHGIDCLYDVNLEISCFY
jgi:hypothetical protein